VAITCVLVSKYSPIYDYTRTYCRGQQDLVVNDAKSMERKINIYSNKIVPIFKLEKNKVLNIIEGLQIPHILEICYLYNLL
jgi:hypothetical protein